MSQIKERNLSNENEDGAPDIVGVSTFSATSYFVPPVGTTAQRPENPQGGDLRFNTDSASLEYFRGDTIGWSQIEMTSPDLGVKNEGLSGARGLFAGGRESAPAFTNKIEYITISTLGNAIDFGDLTRQYGQGSAAASRTRGVFFAGQQPSPTYGPQIDYVTIASTGVNAIDWGVDMTGAVGTDACGNETRGLVMGGNVDHKQVIDYITIATTGYIADFGDLNKEAAQAAAFSSSTRGVHLGGATPGGSTNSIQYVTISTLGNGADFGDLSSIRTSAGGCSNSIRGLIGGGSNPNSTNAIEYLTIATTGNTVGFGDLTQARTILEACSSTTRGVWGGGSPNGDVLDYVEIMTTGNAKDFGDMTSRDEFGAACSNAHGGL